MKKDMYRHGDLLLRLTDAEIPAGPESAEVVLAEGETTGHAHRLHGLGAQVMFLQGFNGRDYLRLTKPARLSHEEHKTLSIAPGTYEIVREQEYDYFENALKRVVD